MHSEWCRPPFHQAWCLLYAFLACCDMKRKIRGSLQGCIESTAFDESAVHRHYKDTSGHALGFEPCPEATIDGTVMAFETILTSAWCNGVPYAKTVYDKKNFFVDGPRRTLKITSWFRVNGRDIATITRLIAHGYPLLAGVPLGKLFQFVTGGDIYCAPHPDDTEWHAVTLHGSGNAFPFGAFFRCRNSRGSRAHPTYEEEGYGSDFNIWAQDIIGDVYGFDIADRDD